MAQKINYTKSLRPAHTRGFGCFCCGRSIDYNDLFLDCPDCAAIFCEQCVRDGSFEAHSCEDDEEYE